MHRRPAALVAILVGLLLLPVAGSAFPVSGSTIRLLAGDGTACPQGQPAGCGDGGAATSAQITPGSVALAPDGSIVFADGRGLLRRVRTDGLVVRIAGDGVSCPANAPCGDGGSALSAQVSPQAVATDGAGTIYFAEGRAHTIRKVTTDGIISRVAGTGSICQPPASCGDGGMALAASFNDPARLALDRLGGILYVADDAAGQVRAIDLTAGTIRLVAGTGTGGPHCVGTGDGTSAIHATLCAPAGLALDGRGQLYIGDVADAVVRRVDLTTGMIYRYAGIGQTCVSNCGAPLGDGGDALGAQLAKPAGLFWDGSGLVIVDLNESLRRVDAAGVIHRIAGAGMCAAPPACGDGGAALDATFFWPIDVTGDGHGGYVIADSVLHELRDVRVEQPPGITIGLVAYGLTPSAPRHGRALTLGVLLDHAARLALAVRAGGHLTVVRTTTGRVGANALKWDGKLAHRFVKAGRYTLVVTATAEGATTTATYPVRLR